MNKLAIIDGNAIIHRAYHAIPPMTTKDGTVVHAVYGFTSMLLRVIHDLKPTHVAVTFDMAGGSHARQKLYDGYKAKREKADQALYDQIPLAHDLVAAFGIPVYEKSGYEADDVIGTIVQRSKAEKRKLKDFEVYIVTGDMDALQLIDDGVFVYGLRKGMSDTVIYDAEAVKARYGFGPERMVDYKAIRGDTSDNIPGVPGIGEKGATELIQKIGGIKEIYEHIDSLKKHGFKDGLIAKLVAGKDSAKMSYELAQIDKDVPGLDFSLDACVLKPFDRDAISKIFQKFEFVSLMKRVPGTSDEAAGTKPETSKKKIKNDLKFCEIKNKSEAAEFIKSLQDKKQFACRALTSGPEIITSKLLGFVFVADDVGTYIPGALVPKEDLEKLFANQKLEVVGHDVKQLVKAAQVHDIIPVTSWKAGLFDAMVASYLLHSGSRAHDIPSVVLKVLGKELAAGSGQESLFGIDARAAAVELFYIDQAAHKLRADLEGIDNLGLFQKIEMPLILVLADMELNGIAVDEKKLAELSKHVHEEIDRLTKKIYKLAGTEFNIASPIQLREILFEKLDIPVLGIKKGKTGLSTSAEELQKMKGLHPIIEEIELYREVAKLQNTYIDVLPTLINKTTHRIHTTFNQTVAATGRLSSTDPNLQNIPVRTELGREIRAAFVSAPGTVLLSADYSQIELRIVASLAKDKRMMEIFEAGEDIHTATAAAIHGVPLDKVTKDMRRSAKEVNFGILYGMGAYGLSWRAEIPRAEAKAFIEAYFREFSGVKKYIDETLAFTTKEGYCETLFGRRRYIPELNATNFQVRTSGERMAINHPIQGTAADLMKMAMIAVSEKIKTLKDPAVKMILQVHDELVLEVEEKAVDKIAKLLKETMEGVVTLNVPVEVEVKKGLNWNSLEPIKM